MTLLMGVWLFDFEGKLFGRNRWWSLLNFKIWIFCAWEQNIPFVNGSVGMILLGKKTWEKVERKCNTIIQKLMRGLNKSNSVVAAVQVQRLKHVWVLELLLGYSSWSPYSSQHLYLKLIQQIIKRLQWTTLTIMWQEKKMLSNFSIIWSYGLCLRCSQGCRGCFTSWNRTLWRLFYPFLGIYSITAYWVLPQKKRKRKRKKSPFTPLLCISSQLEVGP